MQDNSRESRQIAESSSNKAVQQGNASHPAANEGLLSGLNHARAPSCQSPAAAAFVLQTCCRWVTLHGGRGSPVRPDTCRARITHVNHLYGWSRLSIRLHAAQAQLYSDHCCICILLCCRCNCCEVPPPPSEEHCARDSRSVAAAATNCSRASSSIHMCTGRRGSPGGPEPC